MGDFRASSTTSTSVTTDDLEVDSGTLSIDATNNRVGIGDTAPGTQVQVKGTAPYLTIQNSTAENSDGGCEGKIIFEDHANASLAVIQGSHDGSSDDTKGDLILSTHNGSSLTEAMRLDSGQLATFAGAVTVTGNLVHGEGKSYIYEEVNIRFADSTDDTVIIELSDKIPAAAVLMRAAVVVKTASNLGTHLVNLRLGTTSGRAADTDISGESIEILGAGASGTRSTDNTSGAQDIDLKNDPKEVWINQDLAFMNADVYPYICNAGTGNGTTNSAAGTVLVYLEWIGLD